MGNFISNFVFKNKKIPDQLPKPQTDDPDVQSEAQDRRAPQQNKQKSDDDDLVDVPSFPSASLKRSRARSRSRSKSRSRKRGAGDAAFLQKTKPKPNPKHLTDPFEILLDNDEVLASMCEYQKKMIASLKLHCTILTIFLGLVLAFLLGLAVFQNLGDQDTEKKVTALTLENTELRSQINEIQEKRRIPDPMEEVPEPGILQQSWAAVTAVWSVFPAMFGWS